MPRTKLWLQSDLERGFLNTFVELKQMRMTRADSDPDYFDRAFWRKGSNFLDGQKKRAKLDPLQFFAKRNIDIIGNVGKKTEGKMHLVRRRPTHAANARIKIRQKNSN